MLTKYGPHAKPSVVFHKLDLDGSPRYRGDSCAICTGQASYASLPIVSGVQ